MIRKPRGFEAQLIAGGKITLPFQPYPYQVKGVAFLMPRHHALIADEMGLGKTVQVIVSLRLLFHAGQWTKAPRMHSGHTRQGA